MALRNASLLALVAGASIAVSLQADLRISVRVTSAGGAATRVEYYKGNYERSEFEQGAGYLIVDSLSRRTIAVDPANREYAVNSVGRAQPAIDPSRTILIEIESRDTGEQRQMFGHPARHLITTE